MDKLKMHSPDLTQDNIARLRELFPGCVTEAKGEDGAVRLAVDFDLLRQELSGTLVEGPQERYQLNWPGKREALLTANAPIAKTLRPCRDESVDFDTTKNLFIEGDNLDVLKLLQETYLGKVKLMYIDPPYNTGNDFIYDDNFAEDSASFLLKSNYMDELGNRLVANPASNGRFHSDWLSMMYSRLKLARNLLRDDGVLFISIDDNEQASLKRVCDELFGEANFLGLFVINASPSGIDYGHIAKTHDYALFYAKSIDEATTNQLRVEEKEFKFEDSDGGFNIYPLYNGNVAFNPTTRPNLHYPFYVNPEGRISKDFFEISLESAPGWVEVWPVVSRKEGIPRVWRWGKIKAKEGLNKEIVGYRGESGEFRIVQKSRHTTKVIRSLMLDNEVSSRRGTGDFEKLFNGKYFSFPKSVELVRRFVEVGTSEDDIILDFFAGSGTTAQAVMQINASDGGNRRFVLAQLAESCDPKSEATRAGFQTIADISKERIRRAGKAILSSEPNSDWRRDVGFRCLRVDTSNLAGVHYAPDDMSQESLEGFTDNIKPDRTAEDLLFQVMLDWGVDLALPITRQTIQGREVLFVDGNALAACFVAGGRIDEAFVKELATHKPLRAVFRDAGFADSATKINVEQIFKLLSPATEVKCI
jgi:adenine-specific DNA-methyltransferase